MIRCASCGAENPDDNNFCDQCGASLSIIKTENNVSAEYANNPFDANSSTSRKAYNNPFEEKPLSSQNNEKTKICIMCHGEGRVQEPKHTPSGMTLVTKTCPLCRGRRILNEKPGITNNHSNPYKINDRTVSHQPYTSNKCNDKSTDSPRENNNSYETGNTQNNTTATKTNQSHSTNTANSNTIIGLSIFFGAPCIFAFVLFIIAIYISFINSFFKNTTSTPANAVNESELTSIEETNDPVSDIEFVSITYKYLSLEIPANWVEVPMSDDYVCYGDSSPSPMYCITLDYYDGDIANEDYQESLVGNFMEDHDDLEYTDFTVANQYALLLSYESEGTFVIDCFIDTEDGFISLDFFYPADSNADFVPVVEYILNSCSFVIPETEYQTYTSDYFSCEIPVDWEEYTSEGTRFIAYFIDGSDITSDGYFITDISWFGEDHSNVEYEYLTIANNYAFKITGTSTYDGRIDEEYYIDYNGWDSYNGGYYKVIISYSSEEKDTIQPEINNFIDTCSIKGPLEEIEFASTSFNSVTLDIPVDWVCIESSDDSESYSYTDANGMTYSYSIEYITDYSSVMEGDFKTWFYSRAEDPGCKDSYFTNIDSHNAAKLTIESEDQITTEYFIGNNDGMIHFSFAYPAEVSEQYKTIILYIVNSCSIDGEENVPEDSPTVTKVNTETTSNSSNKYAYYGNDTYYIIDLDEGKVYNFFTFDTDPYVGTCSGSLSSGLTVTYNLDGDYVTETMYWSGSGDSTLCVIDSYGFDWYYSKTSYNSAIAVMD
jgi:hypothetical protein